MFTATDILWVKNVTRQGGTEWAYTEFDVGDIFELRFPNNPKLFPTNYSKARLGQLVILFQTLLPTPVLEEGWYVTHLVTPVDEIVEQDNIGSHPYKRLVCVVAKPETPYHINRNDWSFFKPNRGAICRIDTIERRNPPDFTIQQKQEVIWDICTNRNADLDTAIHALQEQPVDDETLFATEGAERTFFKLHKSRERDPRLIRAAKARARNNNSLFCEICHFNFEVTFPKLGEGFIECHHKQPISIGGIRDTNINDLAIVCSNCHRMLHRKLMGNYLTVNELKKSFYPNV